MGISKINTVPTTASMIKSTQTVSFAPTSFSGSSGNYTFNVTISSVNLSKCEFVVQGASYFYDSSSGLQSTVSCLFFYISSSGNTVTLGVRNPSALAYIVDYGKGTLQVIEYV